MPHLIFDGEVDLGRVAEEIPREVRRWQTAVLKTEDVWCRSDGRALLVEGVVVEHSRAVHPVAVVAVGDEGTSVRLWRLTPVERTPAVQRWLALIAADVQRLGAGRLRVTNLTRDLVGDLPLER